jgi:C-terminal processing protease CtpA/Prc
VSSSTAQDKTLRTYGYHLLDGNSSEPLTLTVRTADGATQSIQVARIGYEDIEYPPANAFRILDGNIAYFELGSFGNEKSANAFEEALDRIRDADGLILDVRKNGGGSTTQGYRVLAHLTDQPIVGSRSAYRDTNPLSRSRGSDTVDWAVLSAGSWSGASSPRLDLPVAVLAGPATFSAAEDFLVAYRLLERGLIVGRPTGGSTGQPLNFDLPGGGTARICVKRDTWPDGTDWVGIGVLPDIEVSNTVEDIRAGRDAVIEAARQALLDVP